MNALTLFALIIVCTPVLLYGGLWVVDRVQGHRHRRSQRQDLRWRR